MTALLALVAVAGYQNRDKLAEMLGGHGAGNPQVPGQPNQQGGLGGILGNLRGAMGGAGTGGLLSNGLQELIDRFRQNGRGDVAQSWVNHGPNQEIAPHELEGALGDDVLTDLSQRTGLSREELLTRLSRQLPNAVDKYTPEGHIPPED
jgi:uncharacterized protein YidB (DUF937 family)